MHDKNPLWEVVGGAPRPSGMFNHALVEPMKHIVGAFYVG